MLESSLPLSTAKDPTWVQKASPQMLLWIDGVGGFLVCLGHRLTIGQVNLEAMADVALLADISRHHATLQRDPEGYFLEAVRKIHVNGQPVEKCLLRPQDRLTLGTSCQMRFSQPVPVSASARLDVVSGHRLHQPVDAVLLMADTLVLGPGPQAHVAVEEMKKPVILYRQDQGLGVRYDGSLSIDGSLVKERGRVQTGQSVSADSLSFALEKLRGL